MTLADLALVLFALAGLVAGLLALRRLRREEAMRHAAERALATAEAQRDAFASQAAEAVANRAAAAQAREALARAEAQTAAREQAMLQLREEFEARFAQLAGQALGASERRFLTLAEQMFEKHAQAASGGVGALIAPVQEQLGKLAGAVTSLDQARLEDRAGLAQQLQQVTASIGETRLETQKLVAALRAGPKTRGNWGEQTLRNVLELSGLSRHADFTEQDTVSGDDGKLRPDVTIRLPGGGAIVVDAKVALAGYFDALDAADDLAREAALKRHAQQVRAHVQRLAKQDYSAYVANAVDFVAMFIPGENFFAAAAERDPELFDYAVKAKVIIVTPATLVALAKAVAYGWRQEEAAKNAQAIADLGRELHRRVGLMADRVSAMGRAIGASVEKYNELVGTIDGRVLPQARKFQALGGADPGVEIAAPTAIDTQPRLFAPPEAAAAPADDAESAAPAKPRRGAR